MSLVDIFNDYSEDYDRNRRTFIPCFDQFYGSAISVLQFSTDSPKILDIGAGTGLLSSFVLSKYPKAEITLIDQAENMLELAKERFAGIPQIKYIKADYTEYCFSEKYDAIISALSIHHLEDEKKKKLYYDCFARINKNGIFVNAEQVQSPFPEIEDKMISMWHGYVKKSDISLEELEAYYVRTGFDKTTTLNKQLDWLLDAGFTQADCIFKYLNFAVFFATN